MTNPVSTVRVRSAFLELWDRSRPWRARGEQWSIQWRPARRSEWSTLYFNTEEAALREYLQLIRELTYYNPWIVHDRRVRNSLG